MFAVFKKLTPNAWVVRRTIWPYDEGWGTYNRFTRTVLDTGLPKAQAEAICKELNSK